MGKNIIITEEQLKHIVKSEELLEEGKKVCVDNFNMISKFINLTDPDKFFFVQIIKRWKDNKDKGMQKTGNYHAGGEFLNYFKVHSGQELLNLKQQIIQICHKNNARAYISCNPRSQAAIDAFKPTFIQKRHNEPYAINHAEEILAGQAKDGPQWTDRPRFFLDIDTTNKKVWGETKKILAANSIPIEAEYTTPSGGLHVIIQDKFSVTNLSKVINDLRVFDGYKNLGRTQTVHANFDGKLILYSNVDTLGY